MMKSKWMTTLMSALFCGAFAVGTAASAGEEGSSGTMGQEATEGATGYEKTSEMDFSKLDQDGDGHISQQEAAAVPGVAVHFQSLDADSNGKLDEAEFAQFETMEAGTGESGGTSGAGGSMEENEGSGW